MHNKTHLSALSLIVIFSLTFEPFTLDPFNEMDSAVKNLMTLADLPSLSRDIIIWLSVCSSDSQPRPSCLNSVEAELHVRASAV